MSCGQPVSGPAAVLVQDRAATAAGGGATTPAAPGRPVRRPVTRRGLLRLTSPLALLLLRQGEGRLGIVSVRKLPPPSEVWSTAVGLITANSPAYGRLQGAMLVSLERVATGLGLGAAAGLLPAMDTTFGNVVGDGS